MATRIEAAGDGRLRAAICAIGALLVYYGESILLPVVNSSTDTVLVGIHAGSIAATGIVIAYFAMRITPLKPSRLGLRVPRADALLWGVACAVAVTIAGFLSLSLLVVLNLPADNSSFGVLVARNPLLVAGHAAATAIAQELVFRSALIALITVATGSRWIAAGLALTCFLVADVSHLNQTEIVLSLFPGLVLTGFFLWKRDILICIIGHAGARLIGMLIAEALTKIG